MLEIDSGNNTPENPPSYQFASAASVDQLASALASKANGLAEEEAAKRLAIFGPNQPVPKRKRNVVFQFLAKFANPLVMMLFIICAFSVYFGDVVGAAIVAMLAVVSVVLSFIQEYRAGAEAEKLKDMVRTTATVIRNGRTKEIKLKEIVPGDIVSLSAGDLIPADLRIVSGKDLFFNEASLTGESFPVEKSAGAASPKGTSISDYPNLGFMGSSVVSGSGQAMVFRTGPRTKFGELSKQLTGVEVQTSFDRDINNLTLLLVRFVIILVIIIFAINALLKHDLLEALLFALSAAVGLTPEMLPMIVTVNLSKGALTMAKHEVIVKRLNSIQNFGAMDVLCTDKTGTLTLNEVVLERYVDVKGKMDEKVLKHAYINSYYQTGLKNLLDKAILKHEKIPVAQFKKIDEIPYDFNRKLMSVVVDDEGKHMIVTKGAPEEVFKRCTSYVYEGKVKKLDKKMLDELAKEYTEMSMEGFRVLAVAYKRMGKKLNAYSKEDESELVLSGYVAFLDPPKPTAKAAINSLKELGISVKVLTGDNELVTRKICADVGLNIQGIVTGNDVEKLNDDEVAELAERTTVFARLSPVQKQRVVKCLQRKGHVIGYLGDGINDAPTLKAADVGISVNNAVDVAKESADIILLRKSLRVLREGVLEGRKTFANIEKYAKMSASSNFGNTFTITGASILLPFLPMEPIQLLLNNFLYDMSQIGIPTDNVDAEYLKKPRPWDLERLKQYMLVFGPVSSAFDYITFGALIFIFNAPQTVFHTVWFVESICTQTLVIHIIRTEKVPFIESSPSKWLIISSLIIVAIGVALPFTSLAGSLGFVPLDAAEMIAIALIVLAYLALVWIVKGYFFSAANKKMEAKEAQGKKLVSANG